MQNPDYAARAKRADLEAEKAISPTVAKGWRDLAETFRSLAVQYERLARFDGIREQRTQANIRTSDDPDLGIGAPS
jgi:hypothetical protein